MTPPNHNGYTGLGVDHPTEITHAELEEAIRWARVRWPDDSSTNFPLILVRAAEAHLATLPKPPRKEPRVVYAVYNEEGLFVGAFPNLAEATAVQNYRYNSRIAVLSGEIELP